MHRTHAIGRRHLLQAAAGGVITAAAAALMPAPAPAAQPRTGDDQPAADPSPKWELPADVRITGIVRTRYPVKHPRKIGLNSFKDHGSGHLEGLVRVATSAGVEGIGNELSDKVIGKTLGDLLEARQGRLYLRPGFRELIGPGSQAVLLDLVGKLTGRPAAELLGPIVRPRVPIYDGSIYMRDLDIGEDAIAADTTNGLEAGHMQFKIKIGRGNWLKDRGKGYDRDLWAMRTVRRTAGADAVLMVDANNYYNLEESLRLAGDAAELKLHWMEEMFPEQRENHDEYRKLLAGVRQRSPGTLLADGESGRGDGDLLELIKQGVVQVSQPDIRTLGIFEYCDYAAQLKPLGAMVAPHVWAKHIAMLETCLLGMTALNFDTVEDCRLTSDVVRFGHMKIKDGIVTLAEVPGLGIEIDEAAFQKLARPAGPGGAG